MNENREYKKLLVFLYEQFNGSQDKIIEEMLERKLDANRQAVNKFLKERNIRVTDYVAFFETKFPAEFKKCERPIMIINKKLDKAVRRFFNYKLEDDETDTGGTSFAGETLKDFLDEAELGYDLTVREVNSILVENGIKPIVW